MRAATTLCFLICLGPAAALAQSLTAILEPADLVEVRPTVAGILTEIAVTEGQTVDQGALLAQIDDRSQAERVALAQAVASADGRIQRADAQIAQAESLVARMEKARGRGAAQEWEVEQARQALALATADKQIALDGQVQALAQLKLEQAVLETYRLRAPFAGVVLEVNENLGANVDMQSVVVTIAQLDALEATAFIPLAWLNTVMPGDLLRASVEGEGAQSVNVVVTSIDPRIDPASQTVRIRVSLANDQGVHRPGSTLVLQAP
ncbi:MAG: efflux RND transporter periplasmic adaptor subunit [Pseudomonadota bacterium]